MTKDTLFTLTKLLNQYEIEIPAIQRDYAFGRRGEWAKRNNFIESIQIAIENNEKLHLDFIYGKNDENKRFILLDGQQRITTLWLVAVYFHKVFELLGKKEGIANDKWEVQFSNLKNFSYDTRTSSREFCKALIDNKWSEEKWMLPVSDDMDLNKNWFLNENWFFHSWRNDPTITSMINMLQTIHKYLYNYLSGEKQTEKLLMENITFSFLDIEDLGQPEELYLKMNSRGKQLSEWDNFKAELIEFIQSKDDVTNKKQFMDELDIDLIELFWQENKDNEPAVNTEKSILKLFKNAIKVETIIGSVENIKDSNDLKVNQKVHLDWRQGTLDVKTIQKFWQFLKSNSEEIRSEDFERFDSKGIELNSVYKSLQGSDSWQMTFDEFAIFAGYYLFVKHCCDGTEFNLQELKQTIRIISNYQSRNLRSDFVNTVRNIKRINNLLSESKGNILLTLKDTKIEDEEVIKSKLILLDRQNKDWEKLIYKVEKNPITAGSVNWLLKLCNHNNDDYDYKQADEYYSRLFLKENSLFSSEGIRNSELESNLLSYIDIREKDKFPIGRAAHSSTYSWWSFFRNVMSDESVEGLREFIDKNFECNGNPEIDKWKQWYIAVPSLLETYNTLKLSYWDTGKDFIIEGQKRGSSKKRLLQLEALNKFSQKLEIEVIESTNRNDDFYAYIGESKDDYQYKIDYKEDQFYIYNSLQDRIYRGEEIAVKDKLEKTKEKLRSLSNIQKE